MGDAKYRSYIITLKQLIQYTVSGHTGDQLVDFKRKEDEEESEEWRRNENKTACLLICGYVSKTFVFY